jgi:tryptophan synthase alpha subunit
MKEENGNSVYLGKYNLSLSSGYLNMFDNLKKVSVDILMYVDVKYETTNR